MAAVDALPVLHHQPSYARPTRVSIFPSHGTLPGTAQRLAPGTAMDARVKPEHDDWDDIDGGTCPAQARRADGRLVLGSADE